MQKKNLVFLTKQYPFGHGEQYVTAELECLSKSFEHIYLYPSDYFGTTAAPSVQLPDNVELLTLNLDLPRVKNKVPVILFFLKCALYEVMRTHDLRWFSKHFKRMFFQFLTQYRQGYALELFLKQKGVRMNETTFYSYWFSASALCLAILKMRGRIDHFYSKAHSVDLYHEQWGLLSEKVIVPYFKNIKLRYVDEVFPISRHGFNFLRQSYSTLKARVVYLGVEDWGQQIFMPKNEQFTIVTCSGLSANKRVHLLGQALSQLPYSVRWIHFGSGEMEAELLSSVTCNRVILDYKGQTTNREVRKFYTLHRVDLFVNLSIVEGLPVSIMEALSHGIPALATDVYGTPEAVIDGSCGKLIPVDFTIEQLTDQIRWMMDHPEELNVMRSIARQIFEEKFQAEKNHTEFARYLHEQA